MMLIAVLCICRKEASNKNKATIVLPSSVKRATVGSRSYYSYLLQLTMILYMLVQLGQLSGALVPNTNTTTSASTNAVRLSPPLARSYLSNHQYSKSY